MQSPEENRKRIEFIKQNAKIILANIAITALLLFLVESVSSIAWFQTHKGEFDAPLASVDILRYILDDAPNEYEKLEVILELRQNGIKAYPTYLFDAQLHMHPTPFHLAHPIESTLVYCDENGFYSIFETDEIGFRNPNGQLGEEVDFVFIGDSFTEGACVNDEDTFAGVFRENGYSVLNLGKAGSGPLFQLATLKEYGPSVSTKTVVWYVFTPNDLMNLREEKTTKLISYLVETDFSQNLLSNKLAISEQLKAFLEDEIELNLKRRSLELPPQLFHGYGESLDEIEAEEKEVPLLKQVAEEIRVVSNNLGARLVIVLIDHPDLDQRFQDITSNALLEFADETETSAIVLSRDYLTSQEENLYSRTGRHFGSTGYRLVAKDVIQKLKE